MIFRDVLKRNTGAIILWAVFAAVNITVAWLYGEFSESVVYSVVLGLFFLCVYIAACCGKEKKRYAERCRAAAAVVTDRSDLPVPGTLAEEDYIKMIRVLGDELEKISSEAESGREDALDYYTNWVHQIKTPIAVMRMKLADDTPENRALLSELFRIEQYVDMVLQYVRLGSSSNDLVVSEYPLDDIIRESIHRFAPQFVEKKIGLDYAGTDMSVVTDRKWLSCIIDQIISNALKYTSEGTITVRVEDRKLKISDTGIGIAKEDIPRIFEKGYTGYNGRLGRKSSGLGLYLAKKASEMISVPISAESTQGSGSTFTLDLGQERREYIRE